MARKDVIDGKRNEEGIALALPLLKQRFGERFQTGQSFRDQHSHTTTYLPSQRPDGAHMRTGCTGNPVPLVRNWQVFGNRPSMCVSGTADGRRGRRSPGPSARVC